MAFALRSMREIDKEIEQAFKKEHYLILVVVQETEANS